ncbi:MAG: glycosyltransferase family 4 protein [Deltaproteobacteria bacterium]|nr:glycosyltransferase family 4 protein [Deltaproteobacteria bacterium]
MQKIADIRLQDSPLKDRVGLLIIYYYFPPRGGVAVQRVVKLCKYLPQFGIDVTVLTSGARYASFVDETLMQEIPSGVRPHSQQLIGLLLKRRLGIPWIADFRDPWTSDLRFMQRKGLFNRWIEKWMEKRVLRRADCVIATCEAAVESFRRKAGRNQGARRGLLDKFVCITNGYDPDDYDYAIRPPDDVLIFSYVGSTGQYISDPSLFLRALRMALDQEPALARKIRLNFIGSVENRIKRQVEKLGLLPVVHFFGNVPHREAVRMMCESHVLLLFELPVQDGRPTLVLPSKVFEYIGARRPIMAMVTNGDSRRMVSDYDGGIVVDPHDIDTMAKQVKRYFELFSKGQLQPLPTPPLELSREYLAKKFADITRKISA